MNYQPARALPICSLYTYVATDVCRRRWKEPGSHDLWPAECVWTDVLFQSVLKSPVFDRFGRHSTEDTCTMNNAIHNTSYHPTCLSWEGPTSFQNISVRIWGGPEMGVPPKNHPLKWFGFFPFQTIQLVGYLHWWNPPDIYWYIYIYIHT